MGDSRIADVTPRVASNGSLWKLPLRNEEVCDTGPNRWQRTSPSHLYAAFVKG